MTPGFYTCRLLSVNICCALEVVCSYFVTYILHWLLYKYRWLPPCGSLSDGTYSGLQKIKIKDLMTVCSLVFIPKARVILLS